MTLSNLVRKQVAQQIAAVVGKDMRTIKLPKCFPAFLLMDFIIGQFVVCPLGTVRIYNTEITSKKSYT